tara:strand:- start:972 stop:2144 length:1173 start_codon:yes stop_codon:yes gene_type:complete
MSKEDKKLLESLNINVKTKKLNDTAKENIINCNTILELYEKNETLQKTLSNMLTSDKSLDVNSIDDNIKSILKGSIKKLCMIYRSRDCDKFFWRAFNTKYYYTLISQTKNTNIKEKETPALVIFNGFVQTLKDIDTLKPLNKDQTVEALKSIVYERDNFNTINNSDGEEKKDDGGCTPVNKDGDVFCDDKRVKVKMLNIYCDKIVEILNRLLEFEVLPKVYITKLNNKLYISKDLYGNLNDENKKFFTTTKNVNDKNIFDYILQKINLNLQKDTPKEVDMLIDDIEQLKNINNYKKDFGIKSDVNAFAILENINTYIDSGENDEIKPLLTQVLNGTLDLSEINKNDKELIKCIMTYGGKVNGKEIDNIEDLSACSKTILKVYKTYKELRF